MMMSKMRSDTTVSQIEVLGIPDARFHQLCAVPVKAVKASMTRVGPVRRISVEAGRAEMAKQYRVGVRELLKEDP
jgi:hypothetical protein